MSRLLLVCRLAVRDLRWRPAQAVLLLLAITAATATLTLGLALRGVASLPYQQTMAATNGPDVVARLAGQTAGHGQATATAAPVRSQVSGLIRLPGVTSYSGPYPIASAVLRTRGLSAGVEAEGRGPGQAPVDQPKLTAGRWMGPGGIVLERTFAAALGAGVGDRVTLNGRSFLVTGIAVTAAETPYPNLCYVGCVFSLNSRQLTPGDIGLAWVTVTDARALATPQAPLYYVMNLRVHDPAVAQSLVNNYPSPANGPWLSSWQQLRSADGLLIQDEQQVLSPGAWLTGLLAVASVAVLAGGRMTERIRRVGLLKAVGGTPGLVTAVLLAENLILALLAAAAGLVIGWLAAPVITSPGAGLIGSAGAPSLTPGAAGLVVAVAFVVAFASTLSPAIRAARTSTVSALDNAARPPRRRAWLIALSARLPVPALLGLRMAARRPRRAALGAASVAVTVTGIVAVLAFHATLGSRKYGPHGLNNPVASRDGQVVLVLTVVLIALAVLNAMFTAWATVLDTRRSSALARALGASPRQVNAAIAVTQLLPALPGALVGVPLGIELFALANSGGVVTVPPSWWLAVAVLATLLAVAGLTSIPARIGSRRPVAEVLAVETA